MTSVNHLPPVGYYNFWKVRFKQQFVSFVVCGSIFQYILTYYIVIILITYA